MRSKSEAAHPSGCLQIMPEPDGDTRNVSRGSQELTISRKGGGAKPCRLDRRSSAPSDHEEVDLPGDPDVGDSERSADLSNTPLTSTGRWHGHVFVGTRLAGVSLPIAPAQGLGRRFPRSPGGPADRGEGPVRRWAGASRSSLRTCVRRFPVGVGTSRHAPGHSGGRCPPDKRRTGFELTPSGETCRFNLVQNVTSR